MNREQKLITATVSVVGDLSLHGDEALEQLWSDGWRIVGMESLGHRMLAVEGETRPTNNFEVLILLERESDVSDTQAVEVPAEDSESD
jgi:hypothetical protein